jgi:hypothetical protein
MVVEAVVLTEAVVVEDPPVDDAPGAPFPPVHDARPARHAKLATVATDAVGSFISPA